MLGWGIKWDKIGWTFVSFNDKVGQKCGTKKEVQKVVNAKIGWTFMTFNDPWGHTCICVFMIIAFI